VDRYTDDVHYIGGAVLGSHMLSWSAYMLCINALPPDPRIVGDDWRDLWQKRLECTPPYVREWLSHPRRDSYWKHGSVSENYDAIACPVFAVGGWADGYTNAVLHLLQNLSVPRQGLIGPWSHDYPYEAVPGPQIGFLQECVRWWDHWLKGIENGIMDEPMLRVWMQESVPPRTHYDAMPGRWVAEQKYPSPNIAPLDLFLDGHSLAASPPSCERTLTVSSPQSTGLDAGEWCPHGYPGEMPGDQRADDGQSLCFDSAPFSAPVEILGFPRFTCTLAADRAIAFLIARLCDVAPDGSSLLVSRGVLNLTHRDSHETPAPLVPGEFYTITLVLKAAAHSLTVGHVWRLALSTAYWNHVFPAPETVTLNVRADSAARLTLPIRAPSADAPPPAFFAPQTAAPIASELLREPDYERRSTRDLGTNLVQFTNRIDGGCRELSDQALVSEWRVDETFSIIEGEPLTARILSNRMRHVERADWNVRVETSSTLHADAQSFYVTDLVKAYEGETLVFERTHNFSTPRDLL
jgi:predicted acyl esterase